MRTAFRILGGIVAAFVPLIVCLIFPSPVVTSMAFSLAFGTVLVGLVGGIVDRGRRAAFWRGFVPVAAAYLAMALMNENLLGTNRGITHVFSDETPRSWLPTSRTLAAMYEVLGGEEIWTSGGTRVPAGHLLIVEPEDIPMSLDMSALQEFLTTGHCVFAVLFGVAGGWFGIWLVNRPQAEGAL